MCGIAGYWNHNQSDRNLGRRMADAITTRGPDDQGVWGSPEDGITLAHRRLSILDLSPAGHQPMESRCKRYVMVFNGEIYNHLALRNSLEQDDTPMRWNGHSDTETLLACFAAWGVHHTLKRALGMFAIALWDRQTRTLSLARDRLGEKPIYWGWHRETLLFGSDLKALRKHPHFDAEIDRGALALLLRHSYIPAPHSIYKGIQKLLPGHLVSIPLRGDIGRSQAAIPQPYWSFNQVLERGLAKPFSGDDDSAVDALESALARSIRDQMVADVPLGAFLSGGVDSSTIVALMQAQSNRPIMTFTIGFREGGYNEAVHAKAVARHLGTDHQELYVSSKDAIDVVPNISDIYSEPFGDSSQIPTFLLSRMAKNHVTVALSGDGGDELFGGYNRYLAASTLWRPAQKLPPFARRLAAGGLTLLNPAQWDQLFGRLDPVLPKQWRIAIPGEKARKLADILSLNGDAAFYKQLTSQWTDPGSVVIGAHEPDTLISTARKWPRTDSLEHTMMAIDSQTYLAEDILTKVDRAAMAVSLETRIPMLDARVVELAWQLPLHMKIRNRQGKWVLRKVLDRYVPRELIERPKMGFGIPLDSWLRGPLREWAESLIAEERLQREGYFYPEPIRSMWREHLSGTHNWQYHLWNVLMFQAWLDRAGGE